MVLINISVVFTVIFTIAIAFHFFLQIVLGTFMVKYKKQIDEQKYLSTSGIWK